MSSTPRCRRSDRSRSQTLARWALLASATLALAGPVTADEDAIDAPDDPPAPSLRSHSAARPPAEPVALPVAAQQATANGGAALEALARALQRAQASVVGVRSSVVDGARSAQTLGSQRQGSGVVVDADGLVLTIGYLVLEAERVDLVLDDDHEVPARVVAYDTATGFGLVQSLVPLDRPPAALGTASGLDAGAALLVASGGDLSTASIARLVTREAYTGYWEYHLDDALYTAPVHAAHSGAGLFNLQGELVGVGSLALRDLPGPHAGALPGNMFVPVDLLKPIYAELRQRGHAQASERPWIGVTCRQDEGAVRVMKVAEDSPADAAGLEHGDQIVSIDGQPVDTIASLWKALWRGGAAYRDVVLDIRRGDEARTLRVHAVDRMATLRRAQGI